MMRPTSAPSRFLQLIQRRQSIQNSKVRLGLTELLVGEDDVAAWGKGVGIEIGGHLKTE